MGVDAKLSVRFRSAHPPGYLRDLELLGLGRRLAEVVGSTNFFHYDDRGCLQERKPAGEDDDEGGWNGFKLIDAPFDANIEASALAPDDRVTADIRWYGRYYGPGYERGDLFSILSARVWCLLNLPDATVYYGGDSGDSLNELTDEEVGKLLVHWASPEGRAYFQYGFGEGHKPAPFHPVCRVYGEKMVRNGSGGDYAAFYSIATGEKAVWKGGKWLEKGDQTPFGNDVRSAPIDPASWKPKFD